MTSFVGILLPGGCMREVPETLVIKIIAILIGAAPKASTNRCLNVVLARSPAGPVDGAVPRMKGAVLAVRAITQRRDHCDFASHLLRMVKSIGCHVHQTAVHSRRWHCR